MESAISPHSNETNNGNQYPEVPAEEFVPYANAIANLLSEPSSKLIILLYGVSGSGKSFLRKRLIDQLPSTLGITPRLFSLDEYRIQANDGEYPVGDANHKSINKKVIPMFEKDLANSRDRLLFVDNMHLRWSPDWRTAVDKAMNEGYYLLPLTPPLSEYLFCTNRSEHGVKETLFFEMTSQWGGYKFSPFLYRLIAPAALKGMTPLKGDRFVKLKLFRWGRGWLYIQDNYLGYIDREMVYAVLRAGEEMRGNGVEEYFMQKDGNIHITLIEPGKLDDKNLIKLVQSITAMFTNAPETVYTGVGALEDVVQDKQTYFLTVDQTSQAAWGDVIAKASANKFSKNIELQPDGVHVTIGFKNGDIWRRSKRIDPIFPFNDPASTTKPHIFLPQFRGALNTPPQPDGREGSPGVKPLPIPKDVGNVFNQQLQKWLKGRPVSTSAFPRAQLAIFDYLISHRNISNTVKAAGHVLLAHRRSGAHVPHADGRDPAAQPRAGNRPRQEDRGDPQAFPPQGARVRRRPQPGRRDAEAGPRRRSALRPHRKGVADREPRKGQDPAAHARTTCGRSNT